jgi:hypothetical protein
MEDSYDSGKEAATRKTREKFNSMNQKNAVIASAQNENDMNSISDSGFARDLSCSGMERGKTPQLPGVEIDESANCKRDEL